MRGMYLHAERLLAKAGVARCKGRGLPTLGVEPKAERKGRSAAEVCTSEARKIGEALAPREGSALRKVWLPYSCSSERMNFRVGVAGRNEVVTKLDQEMVDEGRDCSR